MSLLDNPKTPYGTLIPSDKDFKLFGNEHIVSGSKEFLKSNSFVAKIAFLLVVIFIFIILLRLGINILTYLFSYSTAPTLIDGMVDSEQLLRVPVNPNTHGSMPILRSNNQVDGLEFTWSLWMWIKTPAMNSDATKYKHVFSKGNDLIAKTGDHAGMVNYSNAPGLYLDGTTRKLVIVMNTYDTDNASSTANTGSATPEQISISDIPLEKWINVIIRCNQHKLDVYINGTLARSHILAGVPYQNYGDVFVGLGGGYPGYLSSLKYFAKALNINDIKTISDRGPNLSMKNKTFM
jgi:hypothetical protein